MTPERTSQLSPRVSVVIPAYNNVSYIRNTLESVLNQDYEDYEVVIADHSSADATALVIEQFAGDKRLRILSPTVAGGGAKHNWQRVTQEARGELVKLVCGDDLIDPQLLSRQVAAFDLFPDLTLCAVRRRLVDETGSVIMPSRGIPKKLYGHHQGAKAVRATVHSGTNIFGEPCCIMMRADALQNIGGWDDTNPYVIDERTYCRVLLEDVKAGRGGFFGIEEALASFRVSANQWSVRLAKSQSAQVGEFHNNMHQMYPQVVSDSDVLAGNLQARAMAYGRRAVYFGLGIKKAVAKPLHSTNHH